MQYHTNIIEALKGGGVAITTPFDAHGNVAYKQLTHHIEFLIQRGIQYIISLGTTGESTTIHMEEKKKILQTTYQTVNKRIPIIVGVGGNFTQEVLSQIEQLPLAECDAILSIVPYYNKPSDAGILQHFKMIASHSPKPVILYNIPSRTGRNISSQLIVQLAKENKNIIGIKECSGSMEQYMDLCMNRPDHFLILSGDDTMILQQLACGFDGIVSVAANAFPREIVNIVACAKQSNFEKARSIHYSLLTAYNYMFEENNPAGVKYFLKLKNIIDDHVRLPLAPISNPLQDKIKQFLSTYHSVI